MKKKEKKGFICHDYFAWTPLLLEGERRCSGTAHY